MNTLLATLSFLVSVGTLAVLVDVAINVRKALACLEHAIRPLLLPPVSGHCGGTIQVGAFSIWIYQKRQWVLLTSCGRPGCDCGPAPAKAGEYEGQVVRKECKPAP